MADELWGRFRTSGDPRDLGAVFDAVSPELFRVALSLAPDAASAEDALQETWLVALRNAGRHDPARPVVPWLAGILRRKVHEVRRDGRRPDERRVPRRMAPADPALVAESADDTARLRTAIDALPARYREVAVLRWRYGLEPGEIADARRMPPGTVRSLLHRALARLKRDLYVAPALFFGARWPRGLDDVRSAVLREASLRVPASIAAAAVVGGVILAKTTKLVVAAVALVLLIGAGAAVRFGGRTDETKAPPPVEGSRAAVRGAGENPRIDGAPESAETKEEAAAEPAFARGIVVDDAGAPIAGCRVLVRNHEVMGGDDVQEAPVTLGATPAAVTAADGTFTVAKRPDDLVALTFLADGFETAEIRTYDAALRVVLAPVEPFEAHVVDTEGRPIVGADVRVMGPWSNATGRPTCVWLRALTDAEGRFRFASLPREGRLGHVIMWGYTLPGSERSAYAPIQDVYVLERTCVIVDVVDAATRGPLDDATGVLIGPGGRLVGALAPQYPLAGSTAHPGRIFWWFASRGAPDAAELRILAPGHRAVSMPLAIRSGDEPPHLVAELAAGEDTPMLAGRVDGGAGARVEARFTPYREGTLLVYGSDLQLPVAAAVTVAADGSFRLTGIPPGPYRLTVTRAGDPPLALDVAAPATSLDLRLHARAALDIVYVDPRGAPVAGVRMHVQTADARFGWDVRTDASGRVRFDALPAATVDVWPHCGLGDFGPLGGAPDLVPHARRVLIPDSPNEVRLVQPDRCRVAVVVRDDAGAAVAGAEIRVKTEGGLAHFDRDEQNRLQMLDVVTDAEGRASFDVYPCRGVVKALRQGRVNSSKFTAEPGSSPTVEILLPSVTGVVRGRVLERGSGAPVSARPIRVWWDGKVIAESATGEDGRFTATGVPAGNVKVLVAGYTDANDWQGRRIDPKSPYGSAEVEFEMKPGEERSLDFTLPRIKGKDAERAATAIDLTVVDESGAAVLDAWISVRGLIDSAWCSLADAKTDAEGRARLDVVAAERYRIRTGAGNSTMSGGKVVHPPQASVERDPAASLVERLVLSTK